MFEKSIKLESGETVTQHVCVWRYAVDYIDDPDSLTFDVLSFKEGTPLDGSVDPILTTTFNVTVPQLPEPEEREAFMRDYALSQKPFNQ